MPYSTRCRRPAARKAEDLGAFRRRRPAGPRDTARRAALPRRSPGLLVLQRRQAARPVCPAVLGGTPGRVLCHRTGRTRRGGRTRATLPVGEMPHDRTRRRGPGPGSARARGGRRDARPGIDPARAPPGTASVQPGRHKGRWSLPDGTIGPAWRGNGAMLLQATGGTHSEDAE